MSNDTSRYLSHFTSRPGTVQSHKSVRTSLNYLRYMLITRGTLVGETWHNWVGSCINFLFLLPAGSLRHEIKSIIFSHSAAERLRDLNPGPYTITTNLVSFHLESVFRNSPSRPSFYTQHSPIHYSLSELINRTCLIS